ncbi:ComEA family DNA-binding protein [Candidatus Dojkabacteria bacterium]|nr:ComEA family DNA-binding protein [Candidatus Dojkabacteria bacterium]
MDLKAIMQFIKKNWKIILTGVVGFTVGGLLALLIMFEIREECDCGKVDDSSDVSVPVVEQETCDLEVDITGAVVNSGLYCLPKNSNVGDLIDMAGGFSGDVCNRWVLRELNRAAAVEPNSKVYVPFSEDPECSSELISEGEGSEIGDGKVSINDASVSELETLTGVGPSTAKKIVEGRPYTSLEDLMNVKGIGQATFDELKDQICL